MKTKLFKFLFYSNILNLIITLISYFFINKSYLITLPWWIFEIFSIILTYQFYLIIYKDATLSVARFWVTLSLTFISLFLSSPYYSRYPSTWTVPILASVFQMLIILFLGLFQKKIS